MAVGASQRLSRHAQGVLQPASYDNNNSHSVPTRNLATSRSPFTSEFVVPLRFPVSAYIEYAAEDTFHSENYRFGSSALSAGIYLPRLHSNLQLRYEFSEWQTNWYVHHIYQDGMTNYGVVLGQWAPVALPGEGVGAQSHALELIWDLGGNRQIDLQYRTVLNDNHTGTFSSGSSYQRAQELSISASVPWRACGRRTGRRRPRRIRGHLSAGSPPLPGSRVHLRTRATKFHPKETKPPTRCRTRRQ